MIEINSEQDLAVLTAKGRGKKANELGSRHIDRLVLHDRRQTKIE